jgi:hypothetical protein
MSFQCVARGGLFTAPLDWIAFCANGFIDLTKQINGILRVQTLLLAGCGVRQAEAHGLKCKIYYHNSKAQRYLFSNIVLTASKIGLRQTMEYRKSMQINLRSFLCSKTMPECGGQPY